jgi:hypothetical protein
MRGRLNMKWIVVALVVLELGCSSKPKSNPWARRLTEEERVAWGRFCGSRYNHSVSRSLALYENVSTEEEKPYARCALNWDVDNNRIFRIFASVSHPEKPEPPTPAEIEPYLRLIERELPPDARQALREIAFGPEQVVMVRNFEITAGTGNTLWLGRVVLR